MNQCISVSVGPRKKVGYFLKRVRSAHLTPAGYKALALGVFKEAALFSAPKVKVSKHESAGAPQDWHGFISHVGIGKAASRKARSSSHTAPRAHPYRGRGRASVKYQLCPCKH